jgi:hypothetical protein
VGSSDLKQVNILIDAWTQKLLDLISELVDTNWEYTPNCTHNYDGFWAWTDGGGIIEGSLNCDDTNSGSIGVWANRMYEYASDHAKESHEVGSEEYYDAIDEWQRDVFLRVKFQCFFFDHVGSSNSTSSFSGRMMDEPHFYFDVFADPDEYGQDKGTFSDWEKVSVAIADLTEERMEAIAESQAKYFKEQMLGFKQ